MAISVINQITSIAALGDTILVTEMNFKERFTSSGIVIPGDNGKTAGIRPRWGHVYAVGPGQTEISKGDWICVTHGRWSRGIEIEDQHGKHSLRKVDPKDILLISDVRPADDTFSDAIQSQAQTR
jgi:co-chaperonin GroES (HSP10)